VNVADIAVFKNFFTKPNEQRVCCDEGTNFHHLSGCFATNLPVDTAMLTHSPVTAA